MIRVVLSGRGTGSPPTSPKACRSRGAGVQGGEGEGQIPFIDANGAGVGESCKLQVGFGARVDAGIAVLSANSPFARNPVFLTDLPIVRSRACVALDSP